jgi:hypothetical protein
MSRCSKKYSFTFVVEDRLGKLLREKFGDNMLRDEMILDNYGSLEDEEVDVLANKNVSDYFYRKTKFNMQISKSETVMVLWTGRNRVDIIDLEEFKLINQIALKEVPKFVDFDNRVSDVVVTYE